MKGVSNEQDRLTRSSGAPQRPANGADDGSFAIVREQRDLHLGPVVVLLLFVHERQSCLFRFENDQHLVSADDDAEDHLFVALMK